jgi:uncharacterized phage protein (TIGR01671 family)
MDSKNQIQNREIKFRGISYRNNDWIYGYLSKRQSLYHIKNEYSVNELSIGQFTGFKDADGKEIYEGDILQDIIIDEDTGQKIESKKTVYFDEALGSWMLDQSFKQDQSYGTSLFQNLIDFEYRIIGNVFENPELLK